jgi:hypothetical protein
MTSRTRESNRIIGIHRIKLNFLLLLRVFFFSLPFFLLFFFFSSFFLSSTLSCPVFVVQCKINNGFIDFHADLKSTIATSCEEKERV